MVIERRPSVPENQHPEIMVEVVEAGPANAARVLLTKRIDLLPEVGYFTYTLNPEWCTNSNVDS